MNRTQRIGQVGFTLTALAMLLITLNPTRVDEGKGPAIFRFLAFVHRHGVPQWFGYSQLDFSANIVMVIPLGFFAALALPRNKRWIPAVALPGLSAAIELAQHFFLPGRVASLQDVIANSTGAWIGLAVAVLLFHFDILTDQAKQPLSTRA